MNNDGSYTMMAKPIKTLELHYPVIQFLIIGNIQRSIHNLISVSSRRRVITKQRAKV